MSNLTVPTVSETTPKGSQARSEILNAARQLFLTQGYSQTTMRDIAKAAGSRAHGRIYNHFASKEAIFRALFEVQNPADELLAILETSQGETAPEVIRAILRRALPLILKHYEFVELAQIDWREFQGKNMYRLMDGGFLQHALSEIDRIQQLPSLKPLAPFALARLMVSTVLGHLLTWRLGPALIISQLSEEQWIETAIDMMLYGISAQEEQGRAKKFERLDGGDS